MSSAASPLPVYLLTGFLGSGKTTLLGRLVRQPAFADTAVIVNEFGAIGLDQVLIQKSDDRDVVLLDSGCLCCASNSPLQDSLADLHYRRLRGEVPAFGRVVVETSGLADPLPLMNALSAAPEVARHYRLESIVTTLDALHGAQSLAQFSECAVQLAVADRVVLTKTDIATPADIEAARASVARLNPRAELVSSPGAGGIDLLQGLPPRSRASDALAASAAPRGRAPSHLLRYGIESHLLRVDAALTWPRYARAVETAQRVLGERLLRAKGILPFEDGVHAVHGVRHLFSPPQPLAGAVPADQLGAFVLITRQADAQDIERVAQALGARIVRRPALAPA